MDQRMELKKKRKKPTDFFTKSQEMVRLKHFNGEIMFAMKK